MYQFKLVFDWLSTSYSKNQLQLVATVKKTTCNWLLLVSVAIVHIWEFKKTGPKLDFWTLLIKHITFLYSPTMQDIVTYADSHSTKQKSSDLPPGGPYWQPQYQTKVLRLATWWPILTSLWEEWMNMNTPVTVTVADHFYNALVRTNRVTA